MSAQEHDYELGTLDHEVLERDESIARQQQQRGDERRWMILGAAGTLALMTALVGAVALGGNSEPRHLASSLGSPARDLAAVAAQAVVNQAEQSKAEAAPARVARKADAPQPKKPLDPPAPAKPDPAAAIPASTSAAAVTPTAQPKSEPAKPEHSAEPSAAEPESEDNAFAGLPSLPTVDEADEPEPEAAAPSDFAHDDNPFVQDDEDEGDGEGDDEDDGEAQAEAQAEVTAPAPA